MIAGSLYILMGKKKEKKEKNLVGLNDLGVKDEDPSLSLFAAFLFFLLRGIYSFTLVPRLRIYVDSTATEDQNPQIH